MFVLNKGSLNEFEITNDADQALYVTNLGEMIRKFGEFAVVHYTSLINLPKSKNKINYKQIVGYIRLWGNKPNCSFTSARVFVIVEHLFIVP
jgi:hypothetical protein